MAGETRWIATQHIDLSVALGSIPIQVGQVSKTTHPNHLDSCPNDLVQHRIGLSIGIPICTRQSIQQLNNKLQGAF